MARNGHTLIELTIVVAIIAVLTCVTVPRLHLGAVTRARADTTAQKIAMDLRLARSRAILRAPEDPTGCALAMTGSEPYGGYQLIDLADSSVVASHELPPGVTCTGGQRFEFNPLGELKDGSDTTLQVTSEGLSVTITVRQATGMVTCL
jgi:prepilin-type N-terminal cleavage/methylation domain-containing protein